MDCIFCKIIDGQIPSKKVYEDDKVLAFYDLNPQAPIHFLVVPKLHLKSAAEIDAENAPIIGHLFATIAKITRDLGIENGYRIITNCGPDAKQTVEHLHFHVLAGKELSEAID